MAASNKNTAIVAAANWVSQIILALLLVQLLDAPWKQRLLVGVLAASGVTLAYRCAEQYFLEIPETIRMFEQSSAAVLQAQGIEPGSYAAEQFAERLASRDVGGFFPVSNTAAAFFILSLMVALVPILQQLTTKLKQESRLLLPAGILLIAEIAGLILTRSKGGICAWIIALLWLIGLWSGRRYVRRHWRTTIAVAAGVVALAIIALAGYGTYYGRLPSNSMWLRWQYWQASANMISDHWFAGVGPANFAQHYTHYKVPAAPEVVQDPHSLPIALWSQWGLLGLIGFGWGVLTVCVRLARPRPLNTSTSTSTNRSFPGHDGATDEASHSFYRWGVLMALGIMGVRWIVSEFGAEVGPAEKLSVFVIAFLSPAVVWLIAFFVFSSATTSSTCYRWQHLGSLVLACGLLGFLLHNSIDFAIFEPGVGTYFFAVAALALALRQQNDDKSLMVIGSTAVSRIVMIAAGAVVTAAFWIKLVIPSSTTLSYMEQAREQAAKALQSANAMSEIQPKKNADALQELRDRYQHCMRQAALLASKAAKKNRLDPAPACFRGQLHFWQWQRPDKKDSIILAKAISWMRKAAARDPANFRYYQQLGEIYRAAMQEHPDRGVYLEEASDCIRQALGYYPSNPELLIEYGQLLLEQGRDRQALNNFQKALQNEQAFLDQQQAMYPRRTVLSPRLRPARRRLAERQLQQLQHPQSTIQ